LAAILFLVTPLRGELLVKPGDRVAVCGDASAGDTGYATFIESYLLGVQQVPGIFSAQFGWATQSPQDLIKALQTDLLPFRPTVVTLYYGFGDNGTAKPDAQALETRRTGEIELIHALQEAGVRTVVVGSPICADSTLYRKGPEQATNYNQALAAVAAVDKDVAAKAGAVYAGVYEASLEAMAKLKSRFGPDYPFNPENVWQYNDISRLMIAGALLKALGCDGAVGSITIDFATDQAEASRGIKIMSYQDWILKAEMSRYPLSYPGHGTSHPELDPAMAIVPFSQDLNRFILTIKNLPSPKAKVWWGSDLWRDYSREELARGVNLAADMPSPALGPFGNMLGSLSEHEVAIRIRAQAVKSSIEPKTNAQPDEAYARAAAAIKPVSCAIRIIPLADYEKQPAGPIPIIVDTDMSSDCDDVGALALLNSFAAHGEATLLAACVNMHDRSKSSGAVVHAINAYYGHPDVPIGSHHGPGPSSGSAYTLQIHQQFAPDFPNDDQLPRGVDVYRTALAAAADHSVVICSLGLLENLQDLMDSMPDAISPLAGPELVKQKVRQMVVMANTVKEDAPLLDAWPTPILWTIEVGSAIGCGRGLQAQPDGNPAKIAYRLNSNNDPIHNCLMEGRAAWDPTAAWLAVRGPGNLFDVTWGGYWKVDPTGHYGTWINSPPTKQSKVLLKMPAEQVGKLLDAELARPPR
jgi:hypothetical protein